MENCIDVVDFNGQKLVVIKQPGSVRHPQTGHAITKIEMSVEEAVALRQQLKETKLPRRRRRA